MIMFFHIDYITQKEDIILLDFGHTKTLNPKPYALPI